MSIKLTDTQLMMLSAAAQRNDRDPVGAPNLKVAVAQKIARAFFCLIELMEFPNSAWF